MRRNTFMESLSIYYKRNTMEYKYLITLDPTPQASKPTKNSNNIGKIANNLKLVTGLTITELAKYISKPFSYTWSGGIFNGHICNENWIEQSVIGLDFDNKKLKIDIDSVIERFNILDIYPQIWYSSFSDSPDKPKFRVLILLDQKIIHSKQYSIIIKGLMTLFPEADRSCSNNGRFFFGGKESHIIYDKPYSTQKLIDILAINMVTEDGGRTRNLIAEQPESIIKHEFGQKPYFLYYMYRSNRNSPEFNKPTTTTTSEGCESIRIDFNLARKRVKILDAFLNGEWLFHDQLFGLATQLTNIQGGRKLMRETMLNYNRLGKTFYSENNFNIFNYLNKVNYPPIPVFEFSVYQEDNDIFDIISVTKNIRGHIEQREEINKISILEAEEILNEAFEYTINTVDNFIYIFKLPTAIGKTEIITGTIASIAAPTNNLKNELSQRMKVTYQITPDSVEFEDKSINKKMNYYYSIGNPKRATAILYDMINPQNSKIYSQQDIGSANYYLTELQNSYKSTKTVLTTHSRAIHSNFCHDTIIFDEDPLNSLIDIKQLYISDLFKLKLMFNSGQVDLKNIIQYLESLIPGEIKDLPTFTIDLDELIDQISRTKVDSNIIEFFASSFILKDKMDPNCIHYVIKHELPKDKKIIIMSATISPFIYEKLFSNRVKLIDIQDVKQMGSVIQYTARSCSRSGLNRYVKTISEQVAGLPVITFKSFSHQFQNPVKEIYFGNCSGYDQLKGKDIAVVGTPNRNDIVYLLMAKVLGVSFKTADTTMSYQKIEYSGFEFMFNAYDHEELRNIQLSLIESDLIQAVGRARTLRTNAKVELYSSFPLRISEKFII